MELDRSHVDVALIGVSQALAMTCGVIFFTTAALVGQRIADDNSLATVPVAVMWIGSTLATVPASYLMRSVGRRLGFQIGILIGICGGLLAAYGVMRGSFVIFTAGAAVFGIANGFNGFYRFAAVDAARLDFKPMALSLVMLGGVVGGIAGSQLARLTADAFTDAVYLGSYLTLAGVLFVSLFVMATVKIPPASAAERMPADRSLFAMLSQPAFFIAVLGAASGFAAMTFLMTATPLAVQHHGHSFADVANVIQIHVIGMFAPSFITGYLIRKFGVLTIMMVGVLLNVLCVGAAMIGQDLLNFWIALALLGIGWNFLYIGSSTLLIGAYRPAEKARAQGLNDFTILAVVTAAALTSGYAHNKIGWIAMNLAVLVPMVVVMVGLVWLMTVHRRFQNRPPHFDAA
jgi:MFS family permease